MKRTLRTIVAAGLVVGLVAAPAFAKDDKPPKRPSFSGDIASQLKLKLRLIRAAGGESLSDALSHADEKWAQLTAEQRQHYRDQALAFLRENPQRQSELLKRYEELIRMSPEQRRRARWLRAVVGWLKQNDPKQLEALMAMRPAERAPKLIELRDRLLRERKISLSAGASPAPTTRPAASSGGRPTTRPASSPLPTTRPAAP
jgi:hypothetical protein